MRFFSLEILFCWRIEKLDMPLKPEILECCILLALAHYSLPLTSGKNQFGVFFDSSGKISECFYLFPPVRWLCSKIDTTFVMLWLIFLSCPF